MTEDIFQPSLSEGESYRTKSYNINRLFLVAFFGGIISTLVLGTRNMQWLKSDRKLMNVILALGIIALIAKMIFYGNMLNWQFSTASLAAVGLKRELRWIFRVVSVGLYLIYYYAMKNRFQQHLVTGGVMEPLLKDAIVWILVGGIVESIIVLGGVFVIGNFI